MRSIITSFFLGLVAALGLLPCVGWADPVPTPLGAGLFDVSTLTTGSTDANIYNLSSDGTTFVGKNNSGSPHAYLWKTDGTQTDLGTLPGLINSTPTAVSADGSVVVGESYTSDYKHAFLWTAAGGMTDLGTISGGISTSAIGVSADGSVVVGYAIDSRNYHAFRWTSAGGMIDLGGTNAYPYAVSADGNVVVGTANAGTTDYAFRWTSAGGMVNLGELGGTYSCAFAVSADGSVVVGNATDANRVNHAFRWTAAGGMTDLGMFSGGTMSYANYVSADGSVVVGEADAANNAGYVFRWTSAGGMVNLGALGGTYSQANAISANGNVVVGMAQDASSIYHAFRWAAATGMQTVEAWLTASGVTVNPALHTYSANQVSADGEVVAGDLAGYGNSFIAISGKGLMTIADVQSSLAGKATSMNMCHSAGSLVLSGAHGHPLDRLTAPGRFTAWAAGDLGFDNHGARDGSLAVGEVGGGYNFGPVQTNLALGKTTGLQNTDLGGSTNFDGTYLIGDVIGAIPRTPLTGTLTGFFQKGSLDSNRGYLNAGLPDISSGSTHADTVGGAVRVDWADAVKFHGVSFTPYTKLSLTRTVVDAYTEVGGGFPAVFNQRNDTITDQALGVNTSYPLTKTLKLVTTLEGVHRYQGKGSTMDGTVTGISTFSLPGERYVETWLRGTVGVEYTVGKGVFVVSLNGTTRSETANAWLATSYQYHF